MQQHAACHALFESWFCSRLSVANDILWSYGQVSVVTMQAKVSQVFRPQRSGKAKQKLEGFPLQEQKSELSLRCVVSS